MSERPDAARVVAGRYRLLSPLGQGGMGVVWRARDEVLGREVAVKEVRAPAGLGDADERRLYARLEREAWAAARISHRGVVTVYDVAIEDGRPWIVMELVRGLTLAETLDAEGPMPPRRAAHIGAEVLAALRAAHEAGVLHRDVKPSNVLLANDGRVVLTDFGIATVEGTSNLTMTGELVGSPEFLAPERALGQTPGPASDLWSLGVLLYAAVEGHSPFRQHTPLSTLRAVVDEELPPPRRAGPLAPVIEGLLRKDPAERLTAEEAEQQLRVVGAGGSPRTAPVPADGLAPTVVAGAFPEGTTARVPPYGVADTTATAGGVPERSSRRPVALLAAGLAALLLAAGGLTYALLRDDDPGGGGGIGAGATSPGVTSLPSATPTGGNDTAPPPPPSSPPPPETSGTAQSVSVYAQAVRGSYRGTCPPPEAEAPSFSATITVGRTPASVEYRWVTESGESSGPGWRTVEFASGGPAERRVEHTELTYKQGETHRDRVRVEVRSPAGARSPWVGFSVTCEDESPTGGTPTGETPSPSGSVTPRP
ncbi:serine/threonine-protein kinase [Streptomyces ficellus]|uniref:non-specific serine/threonine protein kinase n=1 Tax=Streptomyces ficellus TaxID=1977088 RepID=A0ABT7Z217_9ACTN|nr:serine/threonine-protein kinase [Streptomyces ficellus]MDN3293528.1 serine/threonine-protein kinase [Streptomyces ficellus]